MRTILFALLLLPMLCGAQTGKRIPFAKGRLRDTAYTPGSMIVDGGVIINSSGIVIWDSAGNRLFSVDTLFTDIAKYLVVPYIKGSGSNPTPTVLSASGVGATASISGNDMLGKITLTTGVVTPGSTAWVTIPFQRTHTTVPRCVIFRPANPAAANLETVSNVMVYCNASSVGVTSFQLNSNGNLANSTTYIWYYIVLE